MAESRASLLEKQAEEANMSVSDALTAITQERNQLSEKVSEQIQKISQLEQAIHVKDEEKGQLEKQAQAAALELQNEQSSRAELSKQHEDERTSLKGEISSLQSLMSQQETRASEQQEAKDLLSKQLVEANARLTEIHNSLGQEKSQTAEEMQTLREELAQDTKKLEQTIQELTEAKKQLHSLSLEIEETKATNARQAEELIEFKEHAADLETSFSKTKGEIGTVTGLLESAKTETFALKEQQTVWEREKATLVEDEKRHAQELASVQEREMVLLENIRVLKSEVEKLSLEKGDLVSQAGQSELASAEIARLQQSAEDLRTQLVQERDKISQLEKSVQAEQGHAETEHLAVQERDKRLGELEQKAEELTAVVKEKDLQRETLLKEQEEVAERLKKEIAVAQTLAEQRQGEFVSLEEKIAVLEGEREQKDKLAKAAKKLQAQLAKEKESGDAVAKDLEGAKRALEEFATQKKDLEELLSRGAAEASALQAKADQVCLSSPLFVNFDHIFQSVVATRSPSD